MNKWKKSYVCLFSSFWKMFFCQNLIYLRVFDDDIDVCSGNQVLTEEGVVYLWDDVGCCRPAADATHSGDVCVDTSDLELRYSLLHAQPLSDVTKHPFSFLLLLLFIVCSSVVSECMTEILLDTAHVDHKDVQKGNQAMTFEQIKTRDLTPRRCDGER